MVLRDVGSVRTAAEGDADSLTLSDVKLQVGDFLDVAVIIEEAEAGDAGAPAAEPAAESAGDAADAPVAEEEEVAAEPEAAVE